MDKTINVTGVISSAREGSFSAALVRAALEGAQAAGAQVTVIELPKKNIAFCEGCLKCLKAGRCFKADDFETIKKQMVGADGIIWGSPVYAAAPNAIMKNLIDRFGMLEVSTSSMGGKYMAGIAAANSAGAAKKIAKSLSRFGIGGTFEKCALIAKKQLLREIGSVNGVEVLAGMEQSLKKEINALGIGAMGFGGNNYCLAVHIGKYPTHIAGLPVAVNFQCHASRHCAITI
jgi:multimeric flavodoxin WrbA